jgi:hypothetical protein
MEKDETISGFPALEDTEIPALQAHALNIVKSVRATALRAFYNEIH